MNDSYLVNIVANDFKHGDAIFEPFLLDTTAAGKAVADVTATANGVVNGVVGSVKSAAGGLGGLVNGVKELVVGQTNGVATNGH